MIDGHVLIDMLLLISYLLCRSELHLKPVAELRFLEGGYHFVRDSHLPYCRQPPCKWRFLGGSGSMHAPSGKFWKVVVP